MLKRIAFYILALTAGAQLATAQTTTVSFDSGGQMLFNQNTAAMIALTGGTAADGDGAVLQLGYFSGAINGSNNFTGTFIPLSGAGSANTAIVPGSVPPEMYNQTSIGDRNAFFAGDGTFALQLNFTTTDNTSNNNLPPAGTVLSIRFYNGTSLANSTFYNVVSNDAWVFTAPAIPPSVVTISLDDVGLEFYSIFLGQDANTAFHTTVLIPEPSTYALIAMGAIALIGYRRRQRVAA